MTTRPSTPARRWRNKILAAIGVTSLALIAASPASAISRGYEPGESEPPVIERTANTDDTTRAGCTVTLSTGQSIVYADGYSFSVVSKVTGKKHTFTCVNGTWVETVSATIKTTNLYYEADRAYVDASDALVLVNYTRSTDGGYYAAP